MPDQNDTGYAALPPDHGTPTPTGEGMDLAAIQARCEAATPGPWTPAPSKSADYQYRYDIAIAAGARIPGETLGMIGEVWALRTAKGAPDAAIAEADAAFIAHARTDIPALLSHLAALTKELIWRREPMMCSVCIGRLLASGRACICGGVGTEQAEMHGLRVECFELENRVAALTAERDALTARLAEAEDYKREIADACNAWWDESWPHFAANVIAMLNADRERIAELMERLAEAQEQLVRYEGYTGTSALKRLGMSPPREEMLDDL